MTVFVVQNQMRRNRETGQLEPRFNLDPALEHGRLQFLLSPSAAPFHPGQVIDELHKKLENFGDNDYLLLIGNPCLIGFAVAIATEYNNGRVKLLQWNGREGRYTPIEAVVFADCPED